MSFLSLLLVLVFIQWWGSGEPLQRDGWFRSYRLWLAGQPAFSAPAWQLLLTVLVPVLALWLLTWCIDEWFSSFWLFVIAVVVLLYSLGRGDFSAQLQAYVEASERADSVAASQRLAELQDSSLASPQDPDNWAELHRQALRAIAYRGMERMFAVIFWFFILGPAGALLYRLSVLCRERAVVGEPTDPLPEASALLERWLWLLEWPVVRLMGLTWSMTGNFDTCFSRCQEGFTDLKRTSTNLLEEQLRGALGYTQGEEEVSLDSIRASQPLYSRSLLLWVCFLALVTLLA